MPARYLIAAVSFKRPYMRDQKAQKLRWVQGGRFSPLKPPSLWAAWRTRQWHFNTVKEVCRSCRLAHTHPSAQMSHGDEVHFKANNIFFSAGASMRISSIFDISSNWRHAFGIPQMHQEKVIKCPVKHRSFVPFASFYSDFSRGGFSFSTLTAPVKTSIWLKSQKKSFE